MHPRVCSQGLCQRLGNGKADEEVTVGPGPRTGSARRGALPVLRLGARLV